MEGLIGGALATAFFAVLVWLATRRRALPKTGRGEWWEASCLPQPHIPALGSPLYRATGFFALT